MFIGKIDRNCRIGGNGRNNMELKVGRRIIDIDENDLILDNGCCYQIITKKIGSGFNKAIPVVSKKLFNELKKLEFIFTSDGLKLQAEKQYGYTGLTYWKFNIDRMKKAGY